MKHFLTGEDLFATILLLRAADSRPIFVLEGPGDVDVFDMHVSEEVVNCLPAHGKTNATVALALIDATETPNVLCIVDKDFDIELGVAIASMNCVYTTYADLDSEIFFSGVLPRALIPFTDKTKREVALRNCGASMAELIARCALVLSTLRFLSVRDNLGLRLRSFPIRQVLDTSQGHISLEQLLKVAALRSRVEPESLMPLIKQIDDLIPTLQNNTIVSGHDLHSVASSFVQSAWGGSISVGVEVLSKILRSAMSQAEFAATGIHEKVTQWSAVRGFMPWASR